MNPRQARGCVIALVGALWLVSAAASASAEEAGGVDASPAAGPEVEDGGRPAPPGEPPASIDELVLTPDLERAREHFLQGMRLVGQQLWSQALTEFEASIERHPSLSASFNRALCFHRLQRLSEALDAFVAFRERYGADVEAEQLARIDATIEELRSLLTEVRITVSRPGAQLTVDGRSIGLSPRDAPLLLASGEHVVVAELEGYHRQERRATVVSGQPLDLDFQLLPVPRVGTLRVLSETAGAALRIDGHDVGLLPFGGEVREGRHELEVAAPGHRRRVVEVDVAAGEEHLEPVTLRRLSPRAVFYSLVGLTGAALVSTVGLGAAVLVRDAQYEARDDDACACLQEGETLALATDVGIGVTAALAVATLVVGLFSDWQRGPGARAGAATGSTGP